MISKESSVSNLEVIETLCFFEKEKIKEMLHVVFFDFVFFFGENKNSHLLQCKVISLSCSFFVLLGRFTVKTGKCCEKKLASGTGR